MTRMQRATYGAVAFAVLVGLTMLPGAPAGATFPGADGRIAFDDFVTGQIYALNPDGSGLVQLTHAGDGEFAGDPSWTPDGTQIAYESNESGAVRLWIMDADGSNQHMVAEDKAGALDWTPAYTPDGTRLVYFRCLGRACAIYSIGVDGTNRQALTPFVRPPFEVFDLNPSVSPDGRIAFDRVNQNVNGILRQVYVMGPHGLNPHPITPPRLEGWFPDWSPDGTHIAFTSNCCRLGRNGYVVKANGTHVRKLTSQVFPFDDYQLAYSPSGDRMAFGSNRRYDDLCCGDLFEMNANGSNQIFIDTGLTFVEDIAWGTAPPLEGESALSTTIQGVSPSEARSRLAIRCRMLPRPLEVGLPCATSPTRVANRAGTHRKGES